VLAAAWVGTASRPEPLPFEVVLGVALHDCAWREADARPRRDAATGGVVSFLGHPREERLRFYAEGIDAAERVHPYAGLLASLHYTGFDWGDAAEAFLRSERGRRERLIRELALDDGGRASLDAHRRLVGLFDDLSLFVCLAGPDSLARPDWLLPGDVTQPPGGPRIRLAWRDAETIEADPFPFRGPVPLGIPARELRRAAFADAADLARAWDGAARIVQRARFVPPDEPTRIDPAGRGTVENGR